MGRGMGRGMGFASGQGPGVGRGAGRGRRFTPGTDRSGEGYGEAGSPQGGVPPSSSSPKLSFEEELEYLKKQVEFFSQQLKEITKRIAELEKKRSKKTSPF